MDIFLDRIDKSSACWTWNGPVDAEGYGRHGNDGYVKCRQCICDGSARYRARKLVAA
jgi:hypothetical protein